MFATQHLKAFDSCCSSSAASLRETSPNREEKRDNVSGQKQLDHFARLKVASSFELD